MKSPSLSAKDIATTIQKKFENIQVRSALQNLFLLSEEFGSRDCHMSGFRKAEANQEVYVIGNGLGNQTQTEMGWKRDVGLKGTSRCIYKFSWARYCLMMQCLVKVRSTIVFLS